MKKEGNKLKKKQYSYSRRKRVDHNVMVLTDSILSTYKDNSNRHNLMYKLRGTIKVKEKVHRNDRNVKHKQQINK